MRRLTRSFITLAAASLLVCSASCIPVPEPEDEGIPRPVEAARISVSGQVPTVLARDFDGDGIDELVIADTSGGEYPRTESGLVRVLSGPVQPGGWRDLPARMVLSGERPFYRFGTGLETADLNADGVPDLVLRADTSPEGSGTICVMTGRLAGEHPIESTAFLTITGSATLGQAMVPVDYNSDGLDDLVVSCPLRSEVYVLLGPRSGSATLPADADAVISTPSGALGWSVAGGDFDRDGTVDLALAEPTSNSIFILPCGLTGDIDAVTAASAVIGSSEPTDYLVGVDTLGGTAQTDLLVRSRRTDSEQVGTIFVLAGPIRGDVNVRARAERTLEYSAAVLGSSGTRVRAGGGTGPLLAVGTPGRAQLPESNLKGGLWLLSDELEVGARLDPAELGRTGLYLRPQDLDADWLGYEVLTGYPTGPKAENLIVTASGLVLVFGW